MLETLRERLLTVQLDLSTGLKTLGDKSKDAKIRKIRRSSEPLPKFHAGLELLSRYEDNWEALHRGAMDCAKAGELINSEVVMLSAHWERKKSGLGELHDLLQQIPAFLADLESSTIRLTQLEKGFEEMESQLMNFEELCEQCELVQLKHMQYLQLENYKKKKRKALENFKADLSLEHNQKVLNMEHTQQMKLKERQKFFEEAFQEDMEQYLSTGYLQIEKGRDPIGSMSSMEVNVDMLEQMDLMDMSDQEALDVFLNSGEDKAVLAPCLGPDKENFENEITIQVPSQLELRQKLSSMSSNHTDPAGQKANEEADSPIVQSDDEEVYVDTALAVTTTNANSDISDESDSQTV